MRQTLLYSVFIGYTLGIFCRSFFSVPDFISFVFIVVSLSAIVPGVFSGLQYDQLEIKRYAWWFIFFIILLFFGIGSIRYSVFVRDSGDETLRGFVGTSVNVEGVIVEEPDERATATRLTIALDTLQQNDEIIPLTKTKIIVSTGLYTHLTYGDRIEIVGKLKVPENFVGDNGKMFDYVSYLAKDKIFFLSNLPKISLISKHNGYKIKELLLRVKKNFVTKLDENIPFPESRLAAGLIVAGKRALPDTIQNDFLKSGTLQVVVLSGYNMTIVAETLGSLFSFLPEIAGLSVSGVGILGFTIMAGGSATVIRASIMALIVIFAQLLRRRYNVSRALIVSAFVMLILNPMLLVFDPSFQLSFLSIIGLIYVSPIIKKYFLFVTEKFKLQETVVATIATQLFVLPFLLYLTGMMSFVALPANMLLFLFLPITMLICFIAGCLGFLASFLALPMGFIAFIFLRYELTVVHIFANLPFASLIIPSFPTWLLALFYFCYALIFYWFYVIKSKA